MFSDDLLARSQALQQASARIGLDCLHTDVRTALAFAERALWADADPDTRLRNQVNARKGYDAVSHLLNELGPKISEAERMEVEEKLGLLKSKLVQLGVTGF